MKAPVVYAIVLHTLTDKGTTRIQYSQLPPVVKYDREWFAIQM